MLLTGQSLQSIESKAGGIKYVYEKTKFLCRHPYGSNVAMPPRVTLEEVQH
jgi:hypothetical protein